MSIKVAEFSAIKAGRIPVHVTSTGPGTYSVQASFKKLDIGDLDSLSTSIGTVCRRVCEKLGGATTDTAVEANRFSTTVGRTLTINDAQVTINDIVKAAKTS